MASLMMGALLDLTMCAAAGSGAGRALNPATCPQPDQQHQGAAVGRGSDDGACRVAQPREARGTTRQHAQRVP